MEERPWHRHYDTGVARELDYEELAVPAFLTRTAQKIPGSPAIFFQNARLTYAELLDHVERLAYGLSELGVGPGTRVAVQLPNLPQAVIGFYAALSLGAHVVLTNPLYTPREIEHQWNDAGCELAVTTDYLYDQKVRSLLGKVPVKNFVLASIPEYLRFPLNLLAPLKLRRMHPPAFAGIPAEPGVHGFKALVRRSTGTPPRPSLALDDTAVLQYTGGTTGVSKAAVLTHRNLSVNAQQTDAWFPDREWGGEVMLTALPLFHVFAMTICMNWAVLCGGAMALIPDPRDVKAVVKAVTRHRVTVFPGVPAIYNSLNHYPGIEKLDVSSIKTCVSGSAPIAPDVLERFESLTGSKIVEGFGMSESSPLTHANPVAGLRKIGTVGIPVPDTDARIVDVDDPDHELPMGEEGELVVSGPQVMKEYWNKPEETRQTLRKGWLLTGDLASVDEDGFFRIVGRKKDMINCSGLKVFPDEVDAILVAHQAVLEAATIGVPHAKRGETVKSFVVLKPGAHLAAEELEAYCRENLAAYKVPREIEFMAELPKSTVLKVLRRELRDLELAKRAQAAGDA